MDIKLRMDELIEEYEEKNNIILTYKILIDQTGITSQSIQNLVKDKWKSLTRRNIENLCKFFDCTPKDLFK